MDSFDIASIMEDVEQIASELPSQHGEDITSTQNNAPAQLYNNWLVPPPDVDVGDLTTQQQESHAIQQDPALLYTYIRANQNIKLHTSILSYKKFYNQNLPWDEKLQTPTDVTTSLLEAALSCDNLEAFHLILHFHHQSARFEVFPLALWIDLTKFESVLGDVLYQLHTCFYIPLPQQVIEEQPLYSSFSRYVAKLEPPPPTPPSFQPTYAHELVALEAQVKELMLAQSFSNAEALLLDFQSKHNHSPFLYNTCHIVTITPTNHTPYQPEDLLQIVIGKMRSRTAANILFGLCQQLTSGQPLSFFVLPLVNKSITLDDMSWLSCPIIVNFLQRLLNTELMNQRKYPDIFAYVVTLFSQIATMVKTLLSISTVVTIPTTTPLSNVYAAICADTPILSMQDVECFLTTYIPMIYEFCGYGEEFVEFFVCTYHVYRFIPSAALQHINPRFTLRLPTTNLARSVITNFGPPNIAPRGYAAEKVFPPPISPLHLVLPHILENKCFEFCRRLEIIQRHISTCTKTLPHGKEMLITWNNRNTTTIAQNAIQANNHQLVDHLYTFAFAIQPHQGFADILSTRRRISPTIKCYYAWMMSWLIHKPANITPSIVAFPKSLRGDSWRFTFTIEQMVNELQAYLITCQKLSDVELHAVRKSCPMFANAIDAYDMGYLL